MDSHANCKRTQYNVCVLIVVQWNPTDTELECVQQLFKELKDAHNFVRRVEESKIFSEVSDMKTELRGVSYIALIVIRVSSN